MYYEQLDEKWKTSDAEILPDGVLNRSGCGIFSFCNAISAMNGSVPYAIEIAKWAVGVGAYIPVGVGTIRKVLYDNIEVKFGAELNFKIDGQFWGDITDERLVAHLLAGNVAVVHQNAPPEAPGFSQGEEGGIHFLSI